MSIVKIHISLILLLVAGILLANSTPPKYIKGGEVEVILKDGSTYKFSSDKYAVIPRTKKNKAKVPRKKHILSGKATSSYSKLNSQSIGANIQEIENTRVLGIGVQYQYEYINDRYVGGGVDSHGNLEFSLGVGF